MTQNQTDFTTPNAESAVLRRLAVFRKNGFFGHDTRGAVVERATTAKDYSQVFRFVHDTYVQCGWVRPQSSRLRMRPWDFSPDTAVFMAKHAGEVVGSLIVVGDTPELGLPVDWGFSDITNNLRGKGRSLAEMGVQIVAPAFRRGSLLTELQRCAFAHLSYKGYTDLLTIVTPVQRHFMEIIDLHTLCEPRRWNPSLDDLVVLVAGDRPSFDARMAARSDEASLDDFRFRFLVSENPYVSQVPQWDAQSLALFEEPSSLRLLASECPELWNNASPSEVRTMQRILNRAPLRQFKGAHSSPTQRLKATSNAEIHHV
ncbi:MAG: hypothetical protein MUC50_21600 [Myxococcota bacterium]|jgi:hypothetical protein|nr:hypothetical protein [Myxococcota bacterium]